MTPIQQLMLGVGASKKTYIDNVFSNDIYDGNPGYDIQINNGINLADDGGLVWVKSRTSTDHHALSDTERGTMKYLMTSSTSAPIPNKGIKSYNNNGFTVDSLSHGVTNQSGKNYSSLTFKKTPSFFTICTWTGNATNRLISHDLGCIPGMIVIRRSDGSGEWQTYHRSIGASATVRMDSDAAKSTSGAYFNSTAPTSTTFSLGTNEWTNGNGYEFVAYLFAGGESIQNEAVSVDFASSSHLSIPDHVYPGDSDNNGNWTFWSNPFTIEMWVKCPDDHAGYETLVGQWGGSQKNWSIRYSSVDISNNWVFFYSSTGSNYITIDSGAKIDDNQWHHIAVVRDNSKINLYTDGVLTGSATHSNIAFHNSTADLRIGSDGDGNQFTGSISNLRIIRNLAHYTGDFKVPTTPLTDTGQSGSNVSGTVLLCCNSSSITGSSFTSGTISSSGSNVTANSDSPFDDPDSFAFGDSNTNIVKCGSYKGNGSNTGSEVYLGFEPQFLITKKIDGSGNWNMYDSMRGIVTGGNDANFKTNESDAEDTSVNAYELTATGFKVKTSSDHWNEDNKNFLYLAIRRPDGHCGKPYGAGEGTSVFASSVGVAAYDYVFTSGFPVDFGWAKNRISSGSWYASARLMQDKEILLDSTGAEQAGTNKDFDSNTGWHSGSTNYYYISHMFKRHAGMDVIRYDGNGVVGRGVVHQLAKPAEFVICKRTSSSGQDWIVGHKGLNGGTNPWEYYLNLNTDAAQVDYPVWMDQAPTSSHFLVNNIHQTNTVGAQYLALVFRSISGISSVGHFTGDGTTNGSQEINVGFSPRFLILKSASVTGGWKVFDSTLHDFGTGVAATLEFNSTGARYDDGTKTATRTTNGFALWSAANEYNANNQKYIYYAHA